MTRRQEPGTAGGERGAGGGDADLGLGLDAGQVAGEQQQLGPVAGGLGGRGRRDGDLVGLRPGAGRGEVAGRLAGRDERGEAPVDGGAFLGGEQTGGDLGGVGRDGRGDTVGQLDEAGLDQLGEAFAEDGPGDRAAEQAQGGHRGAGGAGEVGEGSGDGVGEALVEPVAAVARGAALRDVLGQGHHGEGHAAGPADEVGDDRGRGGRGELAHERGRGVGGHRRHLQPGAGPGGRGAQGPLGVARQPVRCPECDNYPTVLRDGREGGHRERIRPLQVVEQ
ncbi:hypothetical protein ACQP1P_24300 [Dactylosporangium sp. CA-052675]|uniref:hypothetical protein n=1 Tax=Dactylosporangium sp. CA-052675 TaxID=3239927 RepID=UPI003D8EDDA9